MTDYPPPARHEAVRAAGILLAYLQRIPRGSTLPPGQERTPERWVQYLEEATSYEDFTLTTFDAEGMDEMVVQSGIPFYSLCEHHVAPFFGTATVAYIPQGRIVGLSKLARLVQRHARGLQNQERITRGVALDLQVGIGSPNVAVVLRARHLCMEQRGARMHDTYTTTSCMLGAFRNEASARDELLRLSGQ